MGTSIYIPRLVDSLLEELFGEFPAILVVGPRATGKTTSATRLASQKLRLDRPADAQLVRSDPDVALASFETPLLIDEWQVVPSVLGAVKRAVDDGSGSGRYVLTGSTQSDLTTEGWPATGRVIRVPMYGITDRELEGNIDGPCFLDFLFSGAHRQRSPSSLARLSSNDFDLRDYVQRAMRSGFPEALSLNDRSRSRWLQSYVDEIVTRDVKLIAEVRDPVRLRRYLQSCAANTAGMADHKSIFDAAGIERATAVGYDSLLEHLMVTERLPAWSANHLSRLVRAPKRHLVEPALIGPLLGIDGRAILRNADLLGRVIESYVLSQLRAELALAEQPIRLFHLRDKDGRHEIDIVAERTDGRIVGIEVKSTSAPTFEDAKHLVWLRDQLGDRFASGVVMHSGPRAFHHDSGISFLPISALWSPREFSA